MTRLAYVACAVALSSTGNAIQLLPAGEFRSKDGRPNDVDAWTLDAASAAALIAASTGKGRFVIDYEHQSLKTAENGQPAPAAGWFTTLEWRDEAGLFATDVEWTDKARQMIQAGEYRYISPVIVYDHETGAITKLVSAALTNSPAIDGMEEVTALTHSAGADPVTELRRYMARQNDPAALKIAAQVEALVNTTRDTLQALKAQTAATRQAQSQVSALTREMHDARISGVIEAALNDARLLPFQVEAARRLAATDLEALTAILDRPAIVPALVGMQSERVQRGESAPVALSREEKHVCALSGRTPQEFAELKRRFTTEDTGLAD